MKCRIVTLALLLAAIVALALGVVSLWTPIPWLTWGQKPNLPFGSVGLASGHLVINEYWSLTNRHSYSVEFGGLAIRRDFANWFSAEDHSVPAGQWSATNVESFYLAVPMWMLSVLFAAYPVMNFVGGALRRQGRRKRGLCIDCGYNLTGNVSGRCPECGAPTTGPKKGRAPA